MLSSGGSFGSLLGRMQGGTSEYASGKMINDTSSEAVAKD